MNPRNVRARASRRRNNKRPGRPGRMCPANINFPPGASAGLPSICRPCPRWSFPGPPARRDMNLQQPTKHRTTYQSCHQVLKIRSGLLRVQIPGMPATTYLFPCHAVGDPNSRQVRARDLLGLTGVINQIRLTFDGTSSLVAPCGILIVEKK